MQITDIDELGRYLVERFGCFALLDLGDITTAMAEFADEHKVQIEPVIHGYWENVGRVYAHEDLACGVCSNCGKVTVAFESMPERCSHCGAKMEVVK